MRNIKLSSAFFLLLGCCLSALAVLASGKRTGAVELARKAPKKTVVYLVRHGEKASAQTMMSVAQAMAEDPALTPAGQERAQALRDKLAGEKIEALFSTSYRRTQQTLQPLAEARNLTVQTYNVKDNAELVQRIKQDYNGKTVVVAGHSNTLLPLLEAFGAAKPIAEIADHEYDYLFKVTLQEGKPAKVEVLHYGKPSQAPAR